MSWLFDTVSLEIIAAVLTAIVIAIATFFGVYYVKISRTCKEAGEFLATLGAALEDKRITREEIGHIIKEGKDVFHVWM